MATGTRGPGLRNGVGTTYQGFQVFLSSRF